VVTELSEKFPLNIEIIKKSEMPFIDRRLVNEFPSVAISDNVVFKGRDVSIDEFKAAIIEHTGRTEHLP
jgi:hypothetical protein